MLGSEKNRKIAASLALLGALQPTPLPISGLHKFYLGQPIWGTLYLLLAWTQIPRIASAIEGIWYLSHSDQGFGQRFLGTTTPSPFQSCSTPISPPLAKAQLPEEQVNAIASALRELDQLRQEGLISEYEFEQKRRGLLDRLG